MGARTRGDTELVHEDIGNVGRPHPLNVERDDGATIRLIKITIGNDAGNVVQPFKEVLRKRPLATAGHRRAAVGLEEMNRGKKPGEPMDVERARLKPRGPIKRLPSIKGVDTGSALKQGQDFHPISDADAAGALRPHKALVTGKAQDINAHFPHIDVVMPGSLRGIDNKKRAGVVRDAGNTAQITDITRDVGGVRAEDHPSTGNNESSEVIVIKNALLVAAGVENMGIALICHAGKRAKHGVVLKNGGDDPIPLADQSADCEIKSLG